MSCFRVTAHAYASTNDNLHTRRFWNSHFSFVQFPISHRKKEEASLERLGTYWSIVAATGLPDTRGHFSLSILGIAGRLPSVIGFDFCHNQNMALLWGFRATVAILLCDVFSRFGPILQLLHSQCEYIWPPIDTSRETKERTRRGKLQIRHLGWKPCQSTIAWPG